MPMKLLTAEMRRVIPLTGAQAESEDPTAYAKFFSCANNWTWYVTEAHQVVVSGDDYTEQPLSYKLKEGETVEDVIFYGLVYGFEKEMGPFSLNEFEAVNRTHPLGVERDLHWDGPKPLSQCLGPGT